LARLDLEGVDEDAAQRRDDVIDDGGVAAAGPEGRVLGLERSVLGGAGDRGVARVGGGDDHGFLHAVG